MVILKDKAFTLLDAKLSRSFQSLPKIHADHVAG
jgi:hypothetical protein